MLWHTDTMSEPGLQSFHFIILDFAEGKREPVPGRQWSTCCRSSRRLQGLQPMQQV